MGPMMARTSTCSTVAVIWTIGAAISLVLATWIGQQEPIDSYAAIVHLLNNNADPHRQSWFNFGYWKKGMHIEDDNEETAFPLAAERLARELYASIHRNTTGTIVDVGIGGGDQLKVLRDLAPRANCILGITNTKKQFEFAKAKTRDLANTQVVLGKDTDLNQVLNLAAQQPQDQRCEQYGPIVAVTSLDSAYHFDSRQTFFQTAFDMLAPGGKIALVDILHKESESATFFARAVLSFLAWTADAKFIDHTNYFRILADAGFREIDSIDLTGHTWPRLATWLQQMSSKTSLWKDKWLLNMLRYFVLFLWEGTTLRVELVSAVK